MKAPEIFGLVLRLVGLYLLVDGVPRLLDCILDFERHSLGFVLHKVLEVVAGIYFLCGARHIQQRAYPGSGEAR
jgi:hypothetical protein